MYEFCGCGMGRPVKRPAGERKVEKTVAEDRFASRTG